MMGIVNIKIIKVVINGEISGSTLSWCKSEEIYLKLIPFVKWNLEDNILINLSKKW